MQATIIRYDWNISAQEVLDDTTRLLDEEGALFRSVEEMQELIQGKNLKIFKITTTIEEVQP